MLQQTNRRVKYIYFLLLVRDVNKINYKDTAGESSFTTKACDGDSKIPRGFSGI